MSELFFTKQGLKSISIDIRGWIVGSLIAVLIVSYAYSFKPFIIEIEKPKSPRIVYVGKPFKYCRTVQYLRDTRVTLEKTMVHLEGTDEIAHPPFPTQSFYRLKGEHGTKCKMFTFTQDSFIGKHIMETELEGVVFPFWVTRYKLADIEFDVRAR